MDISMTAPAPLAPYHKDFERLARYLGRQFRVNPLDLLSQAYVIYLNLLKKGKGEKSKPYIMTAIRKRLISYINRYMLQRKEVIYIDSAHIEARTTEPPGPSESEFKERVKSLNLGADELNILLLQAEGYKLTEIAERMGLQKPQVSRRLSAINEKIKRAG